MKHERFPTTAKGAREQARNAPVSGAEKVAPLILAGEAELIETFLGSVIAEMFKGLKR